MENLFIWVWVVLSMALLQTGFRASKELNNNSSPEPRWLHWLKTGFDVEAQGYRAKMFNGAVIGIGATK